MKEYQKRITALVLFIALILSIVSTDMTSVLAVGDWKVNGNTVYLYSSKLSGSDFISILQQIDGSAYKQFKYEYYLPYQKDTNWMGCGITVIPESDYSFDFGNSNKVTIYYASSYDWSSDVGTAVYIIKEYSDDTEPTDIRQPATVDQLTCKDFGKFDTELEFNNAVKNEITVSWSNSQGSGKVSPDNIDVVLSLSKEDKNESGETVKYYSVTVYVSEGDNWLATDNETVFEGVFWTVNQYTLTFDTAGGTAISPIKQDINTEVTPPDDPIKEGYTFIGWDREIPETMPAENITITAKWEEAVKTVSFNPNGGAWSNGSSEVKIEKLNLDYNADSYVAPTKNGYDFGGWKKKDVAVSGTDESYEAIWNLGKTVTFKDGDNVYEHNYAVGETVTAPNLGEKVGHTFIGWDLIGVNGVGNGFKDQVIAAMGNESLVYVAIWEADKHTVYFYNEKDELIEAITEKYGAPFGISITPIKTGHTFVGWDLKKDGKYDGIADAVSQTMGAENLEYREIFKINRYTITFDTDGGSIVPSITQSYGTSVTAPNNPTKEYHTFVGWDKEIPATMPAENMTIKALWNANGYTITFDTTGGSQIDPITQAYGTEITKSSNPTKDGYVFVGWDREIPATMPAENITITAKWEEAVKTVSFDPNGGKWSDGSTLSKVEVLKYSDDVHSSSTPTKNGYDFGGWKKKDVAASGANESYEAIWILGKTVTFKDGDNVYEQNYAVGETVTVPNLGEKVGYTFVGWDLIGSNSVGDGAKDQVISVMGNESLVYVAIWEADKHTVYFYNENDELIEAITEKNGAPFGISPTPTKTGYTFVGWDLKKDGKYDGIADAVSQTMGAENLEYREIFKINQYTIIFDTDGGSIVPSITQDYGTSVTAPNEPTKEYHTFVGWDKEIPLTMPAENMTIKALWNANNYTITFDTAGGSQIDPITQAYGTEITKPSNPTKDGYTFIGWDKEIPETMPAENITITAKWEEAVKTVSFDPNGGVWSNGSSEVKIEKLNLDYNVDSYVAPTKNGYDFGGWNKKDVADSGANESYEAIWNLGKTITFKDGDTVYEQNYAVGEAVTAPNLGEKAGYTFVGWDLIGSNSVGDGAKDQVISVMGSESIVYVAIWEADKHTVYFYNENEELIKAITEKYGAPFGISITPTKTGHTFVGWDLKKDGKYDGIADAVSQTMGAENLEYKEIFKINQYTITFDTNGGSEIAPITQNYGTTVTPPKHPTKVGCEFDGWDINIPQTMPAANLTITAHWKANSYKVMFDTDGGSEIAPIVFKYGEYVSIPNVPSKTGYTFAGWDKEIPKTMPAENIILKAIWTINSYTISFDTDGGSVIDPITQNYGTSVTAPNNPTKDYHTFVGWDKEIPATMPAENMTIKALWNANGYTITFDTAGGSQIDPITQAYGTEITKPSDPTKDGYVFIGWDREIPATMPAENITITAKWAEATKIVSFDPNGGKWSDGSTLSKVEVLKFSDDVHSSPTPMKNGYDFGGWQHKESSILGSDESYVAIWILGETVTFKDEDVVYENNYAFGETVFIPSVSDKIGHSFVGWDLVGQDGNSDGLKDTVISIMGNESITYVAIWEKNRYTVTFYHENGDIYESHTQYYGESFSISNDPSNTGHTFLGWDLNVNGAYDNEPDSVSWVMGAGNLEYREIFKINQYTITFDTNGGSEIAPITQNYGTTVTPPEHPTKVGCEFDGWDINIPQTMPEANLTITARWKVNSYKVTFDTDGGSEIAPIVFKYGESVSIPNVPSKTGYTFAGWDKEIPETMPAENIILKAIWTINSYTISFDTDGGSVIDPITQEYGTAITQPTAPVKMGHTFIGWDQDIPATIPAESITITAKWRINTYTVTWIPNGGTWEDEVAVDSNGNFVQTYSFGDKIVSPKSLKKAGYNLSWGTIDSIMCDGNLEYTAQWVEGNTVTFIDGTVTSTTAYATGADIEKPDDPIKIGYTFVGWDLIITDGKGDGEKDEVAEIMENSNISYIALWSINSYTAAWTIDGEDYVKSDVVYGESIIIPKPPIKMGYTFGGWTVPETMPAEDIALNAVWIINQYTINFVTNGGTEIPAITENYGETIVTPEDPVKTGYTFAGWDIEIPTTMPAEDITIAAQWTINTYKVIWNPNGGIWSDGTTGSKIVSYEYGEAIHIPNGVTKAGFNLVWGEIDATMGASDVEYEALWIEGDTVTFNDGINMIIKPYAVGAPIDLPDNPNKIGHKFIGWDANGDNKKDSVIKAMGEESIVYVALWEKMQYTVTFYYENGDIYESHTKYYGETFCISNNPIKTGHTFVGWDLKKDGKYDGIADAVSQIMGAENLEYKEIFKINQYTITFDTNGGSEIAPITQNYGTTVTPPEHPTKVGCEFDGWDINIPQTMPAANLTITAHWKANSYKVMFDTDGGNEIAPIVFKYGEYVSIPNVPSKTGYTFAGWDKEIPETMPAKDLALKAKWTINQYTITFDTDGGSIVPSITQDYGTSVTAPKNPTKEYHTFVGWDKEIPATMPAENMTIKALWNANGYTITFDTAGGSQIDPITQAYGTEITKPSNPTKDGYTFIGWDKEIPETMPAENITITAKWEEAVKTVSFDPNGGVWSNGSSEVKIEKLNLDYNADSYVAPTKNGYDFGGWKKKDIADSGANESYEAIWNLGKTITFKDGDTVYEQNYAVGEAVTAPNLGEKAGYTFVGWDLIGSNSVGDGAKDQVISVMGNESLVYVAIWKADKHTVYFYNENDELIEAITEKYGAPFGISITPTKTGHTFVGWDLKKDGKYDGIADSVSSTMGTEDLEYRELFAIGQYTITFDSAGGSAVDPITQSYGTDVILPADPTKEGYKFVGWDQGVPLTMPARNITLTARWEKAKYSISWDMNADGVIDDYDIITVVEHGDIPALPESEVPTKKSTAEFSYAFTNSWLPAIKPADGDATYTAQYDAIRRKYTVKFLNYDGTPLQISEIEYGSTPVYSGSTPEKFDDKQYNYTFVGWSPTVETVTKDAIYTATFTESIKKYTVVWKNWDGSVLETDYAVEHGDLPKYNGKTPTKPATEEVNYTFEGWEPQISGVASDVTYTATFKEKAKTYSITWLAEDGTIIDVTVVEYGKIPTYAAPIKPSTAEYSYAFAGWTPTPAPATADATYTATYTATKNKYTVVWNVNGVKVSESYEYGALPEFKGSTDKASDGCTAYAFTGWNKKISEVVENIEYTATYSTVTVHTSSEFVYESNNKGTHSKKHKCCNAVIETVACADALNDGNHKCDFCGADNISTHSGGKATCKTLSKCDECGVAYGSYDAKNHESSQISYSDITKTTHDELFACCNAIKIDNAAHNYVDKNCVCGAKKIVTVVMMNGDTVWQTIESEGDTEMGFSDMPIPTPTPGYVFSGWYTEDGVCVDSGTKPSDDMILHAGYLPGDVDCDGAITTEDVNKLNQYIVGDYVTKAEDEKVFDINADGNVTVADSILLLLHVSGKRPMTP